MGPWLYPEIPSPPSETASIGLSTSAHWPRVHSLKTSWMTPRWQKADGGGGVGSMTVPLNSMESLYLGLWRMEGWGIRDKGNLGIHAFEFSLGLPSGLDRKESACNAGDPGLIPGLGRFPGEGNGNPLQYSCLGNPMDRGAWQTIRVTESQTRLSD